MDALSSSWAFYVWCFVWCGYIALIVAIYNCFLSKKQGYLWILAPKPSYIPHEPYPSRKHEACLDIPWTAFWEGCWTWSEVAFCPFDESLVKFCTTQQELEEAVFFLSSCCVIGVDIEQNAARSYVGFICLIQISGGDRTYVVDALPLRSKIPLLLGPLFKSPTIVKVFHGSHNDIRWLERDFGLRVTNLFDTQIAATKLGLPDTHLTYLWKILCNCHVTVATKKKFQCGDWARRPLQSDQMKYAALDVHFLPFIAASLLVFSELTERLLVSSNYDNHRKVDLVQKALTLPSSQTFIGSSRFIESSVVVWSERCDRCPPVVPMKDVFREEDDQPDVNDWMKLIGKDVYGSRKSRLHPVVWSELGEVFRQVAQLHFKWPQAVSPSQYLPEFRRTAGLRSGAAALASVDMLPRVENRFKLLYVLREQLSRELDEFPSYLLPSQALWHLAVSNPHRVVDVIDALDSFVHQHDDDDLLPHLPVSSLARICEALRSDDSQTLDVKNSTSHLYSSWADLEEEIRRQPPSIKAKVLQLPVEKRANYLRFSQRFAAKRAVYENCEILAPDGELLCHCDRRKVEWYLRRELAVLICETPCTIRLNFEPTGRSRSSLADSTSGASKEERSEETTTMAKRSESIVLTVEEKEQCMADLYYATRKQNRCVVCGAEETFLRFHVVPASYRTYFPPEYKSHGSHDVLLLCIACHEMANKHFQILRQTLAEECDAPLIYEGEREKYLRQSEENARRALIALCRRRPSTCIPTPRILELKKTLLRYFDLMETCEPHLLETVSKETEEAMEASLRQLLFEENPRLDKKKTLFLLKAPKRVTAAKRRKKIRQQLEEGGDVELLPYDHSCVVVQNQKDIPAFIRRCRQYFLNTMKPQFLPPNWNVNHKCARRFGPHSSFK